MPSDHEGGDPRGSRPRLGSSLPRLMVMATAAPLDQPALQRRGQVCVALAAVAWSTRGPAAAPAHARRLDPARRPRAVRRDRLDALRRDRRARPRRRCLALDRDRRHRPRASASPQRRAAFIAALNHTTVARVLFIQAISPVLAAVLARVLLGEPVGRRSMLAMAIALGGVALMLGAPGGGDAAGDGLALLMAFAFALALVITRHRRDVSMAPATCLSQIFLLLAFAPFASPGEIGGEDLGWLDAARRRPDRPRPRAADDRRAPDTRRAGRPDHAARGRPRPALGLAGAGRAAGDRDAASAARS